MGIAIDKTEFSEEEFARYRQICAHQLTVLDQVLSQPGFSQGPYQLGCEVEFSLVKPNGLPAPINLDVIGKMRDPNCQSELNLYNLEYNFDHHPIAGRPFSQLSQAIEQSVGRINQAAKSFDAEAILIGILPTLLKKDVELSSMTPEPRYQALCEGVKKLRRKPFQVHIDGQDPLLFEMDDLTLEGANTSIQNHLQVEPSSFVDWYNAIQLATPIAVAISGNSPLFLGHKLWDETRIAVFKQALESRRDKQNTFWRQPHRVSYGYGWLRRDALEYFAEMLHMYPSLLPHMRPEDTTIKVPELYELRLHQGTVWRWNRGIYGVSGDGHIRIEMRALPSGPSVVDMVANGAFLLGLAAYFRQQIQTLLPGFPFMFSEYNFYRAAQYGLDARLLWPNRSNQVEEQSALALAQYLLPQALEGLSSLGVDSNEGQQWLDTIEQRLKTGITGSRWLIEQLTELEDDSLDSLSKLTLMYLKKMRENKPIYQW